jgi:hypothetical protein
MKFKRNRCFVIIYRRNMCYRRNIRHERHQINRNFNFVFYISKQKDKYINCIYYELYEKKKVNRLMSYFLTYLSVCISISRFFLCEYELINESYPLWLGTSRQAGGSISSSQQQHNYNEFYLPLSSSTMLHNSWLTRVIEKSSDIFEFRLQLASKWCNFYLKKLNIKSFTRFENENWLYFFSSKMVILLIWRKFQNFGQLFE